MGPEELTGGGGNFILGVARVVGPHVILLGGAVKVVSRWSGRWVLVSAVSVVVVAAVVVAVVVGGGGSERVVVPGQVSSTSQCNVGGLVATAGGTVSVNGGAPSTFETVWVECGTEVIVVATADRGYCVKEWQLEDPLEGCQSTSTRTWTPQAPGTSRVLVVWFAADPDAEAPSCGEGAVGDAEADADLLVECNVQLGLVDALTGLKTAALNWRAGVDIASWEGVTVAGSPRRVVKLDLAGRGLGGVLPARLVNLEELTELRVNGNSLTGRIPSELGLLRKLTHVYVAGNDFTGCYPPHWDDVEHNDLTDLGLPSCAIAYDLRTTTSVTKAGSYGFLSDADDVASLFEPEYNVGEAEAVLVHQTDANGDSAAAFYDTIRPGDTFDVSRSARGRGCFQRFEVLAVLPDPPGEPARKLFKTDYVFGDRRDCDGPHYYNTPQPVEFYWHPVPWTWGPEDIREYVAEPVTGPGRYWIGPAVTIRVPDGVTLEALSTVYYDAAWRTTVMDVATGARLGFNFDTGLDVGRDVPEGLSEAEKAAANVVLDQLEASIETPLRDR